MLRRRMWMKPCEDNPEEGLVVFLGAPGVIRCRLLMENDKIVGLLPLRIEGPFPPLPEGYIPKISDYYADDDKGCVS